jgi:hypothetical protein
MAAAVAQQLDDPEGEVDVLRERVEAPFPERVGIASAARANPFLSASEKREPGNPSRTQRRAPRTELAMQGA